MQLALAISAESVCFQAEVKLVHGPYCFQHYSISYVHLFWDCNPLFAI